MIRYFIGTSQVIIMQISGWRAIFYMLKYQWKTAQSAVIWGRILRGCNHGTRLWNSVDAKWLWRILQSSCLFSVFSNINGEHESTLTTSKKYSWCIPVQKEIKPIIWGAAITPEPWNRQQCWFIFEDPNVRVARLLRDLATIMMMMMVMMMMMMMIYFIKTKNKLYVKHVKIIFVNNEINYKTFRNKLKYILHIAEKKHYAETLEANKNNMNKTWTILKVIINSNKMKRVQEKSKLQDNTIAEDEITISEKFNIFFVNIGPNLA